MRFSEWLMTSEVIQHVVNPSMVGKNKRPDHIDVTDMDPQTAIEFSILCAEEAFKYNNQGTATLARECINAAKARKPNNSLYETAMQTGRVEPNEKAKHALWAAAWALGSLSDREAALNAASQVVYLYPINQQQALIRRMRAMAYMMSSKGSAKSISGSSDIDTPLQLAAFFDEMEEQGEGITQEKWGKTTLSFPGFSERWVRDYDLEGKDYFDLANKIFASPIKNYVLHFIKKNYGS